MTKGPREEKDEFLPFLPWSHGLAPFVSYLCGGLVSLIVAP